MADETVQGGGNETQSSDAARPDWLPEPYWDTTAKAPKADALGKDLTELTALRTERDARLASLPKDGKYSFDLPKDFPMPQGSKWDPAQFPELTKQVTEYAAKFGLPQDAVTALVAMEAERQLQSTKAATEGEKKFLDGETAKLGTNAPARREAVKTWLGGYIKASKEELEMVSGILDISHGVQLFERLIEASKGVQTEGPPSNGTGEKPARTPAEILFGGSAAARA